MWFYVQEATLERPMCANQHNTLRVHTSIPTCAYPYVSQRYTKEVKSHEGGFRAHTVGGAGAGA
jgi:hypothetical protein